MPGQYDNSAVVDDYPFVDIPDFEASDPDPDPEELGLEAYAYQPPQPVILISPLILQLRQNVGVALGLGITLLDYIPNEVKPEINFLSGLEFGVDIYNVVLFSGLEFGVDVNIPPAIFNGIEFGATLELTEPQELVATSLWAMNDALFTDSISGYDLIPVTGRLTTTPYLDPIDQVTGVGGYVRFPSTGAPRFISPSNASFENDGDSIELRFEFYLEEEDTQFTVGLGTVGISASAGTRNQFTLVIAYSAGLNTHQVTSTFFLDDGAAEADFDVAQLSLDIPVDQWHEARVQINLTSREHIIQINSTIFTEQFSNPEETPWQSLNPGFFIEPAFIGTFRIRNIEYLQGNIAYPDLYLLPGFDYGVDFTVDTGTGDFTASWDLNDASWTDSIDGRNFTITEYPPYLAYADTPTIVTGAGGYTLFNNDSSFNGLVLRSPSNAVFESDGSDLTFEFELYGDPFPASNAQVLFESSDFTGAGFQWRIETVLYYDFDLDQFFHQIRSSFWLYDEVNEFTVAEQGTHTALLSDATWHSIKVEFKPSTDETIITVDSSPEIFAFSNPTFPTFLMFGAAIGIGNGYWWSDFRLRNVRYTKE